MKKILSSIFPGRPKEITNPGVQYKRKINRKLIERVIIFIQKSVSDLKKIGLDGAVIGLSGGIDSSVCCVLLNRALENKASVVIVDLGNSQNLSPETISSVKLAEEMKIKYEIIKAGKLFEDRNKLIKNENDLASLHFRSRFINDIIFQVADNKNTLVVDTTDKSERLLGRHAEIFYGHLAPLTDFYKSELFDLADYLSLPESIKQQSGCPELLDIKAFGVEWDILDQIVYLLTERNFSPEIISQKYKTDIKWLNKINERLLNQPLRTTTKKLFFKQ